MTGRLIPRFLRVLLINCRDIPPGTDCAGHLRANSAPPPANPFEMVTGA